MLIKEALRNEKNIITVIAISFMASTALSVCAAPVPRESAPCNANEDSIAITENLVSDILDEVQNGLGYADARNEANSRIFQAVINHQTNDYGYSVLSSIASNAIFQYRDMYLRPQYYIENEEKVKNIIADIISAVKSGTMDYKTAEKQAYTKLYQSVNPSYNPAVDRVGDFCYWDIPQIDSAMFTIARKLLINAQKNV